MQYPVSIKLQDGTTKEFWLSDERLVFGGGSNADAPTDEHINDLINTALGVIENGTY